MANCFQFVVLEDGAQFTNHAESPSMRCPYIALTRRVCSTLDVLCFPLLGCHFIPISRLPSLFVEKYGEWDKKRR